MTKTNFKTTTYHYKEKYYIDIVERETMIDVFLYNIDYGVKSLMFGLLKKDIANINIIELIENNLINESYISDYIEEYED